MGISIAASIMYGTVVYDAYNDEEAAPPWMEYDVDEGREGFEDWIVRQLGLGPLDYSSYPERPNDPSYWKLPWEERDRIEKEARNKWAVEVGANDYYSKKKQLLDTVPVEEEVEGYLGGDDAGVYVLRLKSAPHYRNYSSGPFLFDPTTLVVDAESDEAARLWLSQYEIKWEPKWLLMPYYSH